MLERKQLRLQQKLNFLYRIYNNKKYVQYDPIRYVYMFEDRVERELVGLIASSLSFGKVTQIFKAIDGLLNIVNGDPLRYILNMNEAPDKDLIFFKYRFVSGIDIFYLFLSIKSILKDYGSIGEFMEMNYRRGELLTLVDKTIKALPNANFLIPASLKNSACKRLFMYFRWMVRDDNVDLGLWKFISPKELIIPLDTHIFKISTRLLLTSRKTPSLRAAIEVTDNLREYAQDDPVKYDWALSHIGIIRNNFDKLVKSFSLKARKSC